ncbi:hypothetical protein MTO98_32705 [Mucilaginibacter sp. SMC90]|uniref:hypothetical protein n=1 Tax=Mucilaginibacter sp. SMC90 TaxID=2929803 RepID=UPI001FB35F9E|nr:hypothetical protein [Mucilaginibacter sp. SMC90]UOE49157.1 hypothetical protein MTO98_32705 [Mucilaginibacter sp. SMC90]
MKVEKELIATTLGNIDLFLCSSGFEGRSAFLGTMLNASSIKKSIIFHIEDTYKVSEDNLASVKANLPELITVIYPKNAPLAVYDRFYHLFKELNELKDGDTKIKVVIDITTFTREVLLILLKLLSFELFIKAFDVNFVYTPAESYSNNDEDLWLTKGVREIRSVLGYAGLHSPSKDLLLILLSGFEEERAEEIINSFEPHQLILGRASRQDSINSDLSGIANKKYAELRLHNESILLDEFEFSCTNIIETKNQIDLLLAMHGDKYNVVISPLNNKISTLGVAIAGLKNESIQVCYASANQYNINAYSKASDYFLVYNFEELIS